MLLINFAFAILLLICNSIGFKLPGEIYKDQISLSSVYNRSTLYLLIIIIMPILEEFSFRGWFTNNKLLAILSFTCLSLYFWNGIRVDVLTGNKYITYTTLVILSAIFISVYINALIKIVTANTKFFVFASSILFAAIHIFNFNIYHFPVSAGLVIAIALILIPYFMKALILVFVRFKCGLIESIIIHILNNSLILLLIFH